MCVCVGLDFGGLYWSFNGYMLLDLVFVYEGDVGVKKEGVYILELHSGYHLRKKTLFSHSLYSFNRYVIPAVTP